MTSCVQDPGRLRDLASAIYRKELSPTDLVQQYLERIDVVQPLAEPWRIVDAEKALKVAAKRKLQAERGEILGPLHGIPIGVKDVIDVAGMPTRCNSKALEDSPSVTADAEVVSSLKAAGAIILGKVHTTEFAFFDPSPARNPHNTNHTPGGSSSGSGAAVASGTVPLALGTQTLASVNRPAAYCGVSAFKPSTRSIGGFGVAPLAPSFDTVGFLGWSVDDVVYAYEAVTAYRQELEVKSDELMSSRIIIIDDPLIADCGIDMSKAFQEETKRLQSLGYKLEHVVSPISFSNLSKLHWNTMIYEASRALAYLDQYPKDLIGSRLHHIRTEGVAITSESYIADRSKINQLRTTFFERFKETDVYFWPTTPFPAPAGLESTGEPKYIGPWTTLGGPVVSLRARQKSKGLPLGFILAGYPGMDQRTGSFARLLA
ncbi:MAG: hypothetical protein CMF69_10495 [Magnetovibrio sp.]|nr:hypothetical protein [Magnetovibrio sp.]